MLGVLSLVEGRLRSSADGSGSGTEVVLVGGRDSVTEEETEGSKKKETSSGGDTDGNGEGRGVTARSSDGGRNNDDSGGIGSEVRGRSPVTRVTQIIDGEAQSGTVTRGDVETNVREPLVESVDTIIANNSSVSSIVSARSGGREDEVSDTRNNLKGHLFNVGRRVNISNSDGVVESGRGGRSITQEGVGDTSSANDLSGSPDGGSIVHRLDVDQSRDSGRLGSETISSGPRDGDIRSVRSQRSGNKSETEVGLAVAASRTITLLEGVVIRAISGNSLIGLEGDTSVLREISTDSHGDIGGSIESASARIPVTSSEGTRVDGETLSGVEGDTNHGSQVGRKIVDIIDIPVEVAPFRLVDDDTSGRLSRGQEVRSEDGGRLVHVSDIDDHGVGSNGVGIRISHRVSEASEGGSPIEGTRSVDNTTSGTRQSEGQSSRGSELSANSGIRAIGEGTLARQRGDSNGRGATRLSNNIRGERHGNRSLLRSGGNVGNGLRSITSRGHVDVAIVGIRASVLLIVDTELVEHHGILLVVQVIAQVVEGAVDKASTSRDGSRGDRVLHGLIEVKRRSTISGRNRDDNSVQSGISIIGIRVASRQAESERLALLDTASLRHGSRRMIDMNDRDGGVVDNGREQFGSRLINSVAERSNRVSEVTDISTKVTNNRSTVRHGESRVTSSGPSSVRRAIKLHEGTSEVDRLENDADRRGDIVGGLSRNGEGSPGLFVTLNVDVRGDGGSGSTLRSDLGRTISRSRQSGVISHGELNDISSPVIRFSNILEAEISDSRTSIVVTGIWISSTNIQSITNSESGRGCDSRVVILSVELSVGRNRDDLEAELLHLRLSISIIGREVEVIEDSTLESISITHRSRELSPDGGIVVSQGEGDSGRSGYSARGINSANSDRLRRLTTSSRSLPLESSEGDSASREGDVGTRGIAGGSGEGSRRTSGRSSGTSEVESVRTLVVGDGESVTRGGGGPVSSDDLDLSSLSRVAIIDISDRDGPSGDGAYAVGNGSNCTDGGLMVTMVDIDGQEGSVGVEGSVESLEGNNDNTIASKTVGSSQTVEKARVLRKERTSSISGTSRGRSSDSTSANSTRSNISSSGKEDLQRISIRIRDGKASEGKGSGGKIILSHADGEVLGNRSTVDLGDGNGDGGLSLSTSIISSNHDALSIVSSTRSRSIGQGEDVDIKNGTGSQGGSS